MSNAGNRTARGDLTGAYPMPSSNSSPYVPGQSGYGTLERERRTGPNPTALSTASTSADGIPIITPPSFAERRHAVYLQYRDAVNMTAAQLQSWASDPCSKRASLDSSPIRRNLALLSKPEADWTEGDVRDAARTVSFVKRMRAVHEGKAASADCHLSKRDIALANWGHATPKARRALLTRT